MNRGINGPVAPASRIIEVDIVRGFALFGVLLVNMYGFGADSIAWSFPTDKLAFLIMRVFFESKSWTLFSMLFGFGFAVQLQRAHIRGFSILPSTSGGWPCSSSLGPFTRCCTTATS